jgi:hypothetical protein
MQHLKGSGTPVLYIGRTVFKRWKSKKIKGTAVNKAALISNYKHPQKNYKRNSNS